MANEEWGHPDGHPEPVILPDDFHEQSREKFGKLKHTDISFEQYLEIEKSEFHRQKTLEKNPALKYKPGIGRMSPCGNGDFEKTLDVTQWQGAYGTLPLNVASLTAGIVSGVITASTAHQTWVGTGVDPNVGIPTTAQGSAGAVRIGNAVNGCGCELLSKTFIVTPAVSTIKFWYAVVLQNPAGHPPSVQPFFQVRVTDAGGSIVPGAFDFGSGSDTLVADSTNPFFQTLASGSGTIVYKDWSCAQINLLSQLGKQVTVEFITADCGYCGHWGYAYIDNFCGNCQGSPTGDLGYDCEASTHCGPGKVCFDYSLPTTKDKAGNTITGTVTITLDLYQNGVLAGSLNSGVLSSGTSYCFAITPALLAGLNASLGGFDFVATGHFAIGSTPLGTMLVGAAPDGVEAGQNNDYQIACKSCMDIRQDQDAYLHKQCAGKYNLLPSINCDCPDAKPQGAEDCHCDCIPVKLPDLMPCISVKWGDSRCDRLETNDVEVLCVTVCNCYSNVTFSNLSIGRIGVTDMAGNPVPLLPDGTPSVQIFPSGPICFGSLGPCKSPNQPSCVSRELVLYTRGAIGKDYHLSFEGICFSIVHHFEAEKCFVISLCQD
jgi:hypothetical protein